MAVDALYTRLSDSIDKHGAAEVAFSDKKQHRGDIMKTIAGRQMQSFCNEPENRRQFRLPLFRPLQLFGASLMALICMPLIAQEIGHLNRTIETLEDGKPVFGLFTSDFSLTNARALAGSDLDYIFIDMEHSPFDTETLRAFLLGMTDKARILEKGSVQMDVTPLVRIPMYGREELQFLVKQVLDVGAFGIVFPFIGTREQAVNAVASMRYPAQRGDAALGGRMDFGGFMEAYTQYFGTEEQLNLPARSAVQVAGLARPGMLVEVEVILARPKE